MSNDTNFLAGGRGRQATVPSPSCVEVWSPHIANLADATIEESIHQYRKGLLNILCSCNITRERISTLTNKTRIQFDIQGCVQIEWQVADLLGNTSHQTPLIYTRQKLLSTVSQAWNQHLVKIQSFLKDFMHQLICDRHWLLQSEISSMLCLYQLRLILNHQISWGYCLKWWTWTW